MQLDVAAVAVALEPGVSGEAGVPRGSHADDEVARVPVVGIPSLQDGRPHET
jgi:hypothetical protein